ncbi:MAG: MFS transporter [Acidobacteria bacterium]|nr:MFS transporter [Acidobacteriota bacterium]
MSEVHIVEVVDRDAAAFALEPVDGAVLERKVGDGRFVGVEGPFQHYERIVTTEDRSDGSVEVSQSVSYKLAIPIVGWLFARSMRRELSRLPSPDTGLPWWSPPERLTERSARSMGLLSGLSFIVGYSTGVLTQTMTFAADEFGASDSTQSDAFAVIRVGVVFSLLLVAIADRHGRRRVLLAAVAASCFATAAGAVAPNMEIFTATQTVTRTLTTTAGVLLVVVAAEEMGRRSRAFAVSVLALSSGIGGLIAVLLLSIADLSVSAWRVLFVIPLVFLPLWHVIARSLSESKRFVAAEATDEDDVLRHTSAARQTLLRRLVLFSVTSLIFAIFLSPAFQLLNDFLRDDRGFSAGDISLFRVVTTAPGIIGMVVGGRAAELVGRRAVAAVAIAIGVTGLTGMYLSSGPAMWMFSILGILGMAATVPALGVYGPEMFPTALRGRANAAITVAGVCGAVIGLVIAGRLSDRWGDLGEAIAVLAVGPVLVIAIVIVLFPETADRELEDINPEDAPILDYMED